VRLLSIILVSLLLLVALWGVLSAMSAQASTHSMPHEPYVGPGQIMPGVMPPSGPQSPVGAQRLATQTGVITADVPILIYHHVGAPYHNQYNVPLNDFEAQMDYLAQSGYAAVSVDQIAAALRGQGSLPRCPVAITFDDGYADVYHNALPVLRKHGFKATFYLVSSYINMSKQYMDWDQVRALVDEGMFIGSHSYNHSYITSTVGYTMTRQIAGSKAKLEANLGISVTTFSYPYGATNGFVMRVVSDTGYVSAVGAGYSFHQSSQRVYNLRRTAVYNDTKLPVFISRLPKRGPDGTGLCPLPPQVLYWRQLRWIEKVG